MGFGDVLADLASIGYDAEWQVISAAAIGAPHKRERVFIVAYVKSEFSNVGNNNARIGLEFKTLSEFRNNGGSQSLANTDSRRREQCEPKTESLSGISSSSQRNYANWWQVEPDVGRVANGVSDRVDRLKGLGNAIVPQVAELVGALVMEHAQ